MWVSVLAALTLGTILSVLPSTAPYDDQGDSFRARLRMNEGRPTVKLRVRVSTSVTMSGWRVSGRVRVSVQLSLQIRVRGQVQGLHLWWLKSSRQPVSFCL